ncbi:MAG: helix-turn-helix domain-containing protein [Spirochaetes bacterium]|nr:helix-turn-helix domain-containing protein [Spirochaetota bacterium]MBU1082246.1 helix-turn-helix domain-containing protein [Spirochaetota bacterium]
MTERPSLEGILSDPELAGFALRDGAAPGSIPVWVLEATGPSDAEEARPGDVVVAGRPRGSDGLSGLLAACASSGACAVALPDDIAEASAGIAVIAYPSWIPRHRAAACLAKALWPGVAEAPAARAREPDPGVAAGASTRRRVLAVDSSPAAMRLASPGRIDAAAILGPYMPPGVVATALPAGRAQESYLLLRIGEGVAPSELRLSLRAAAEENALSIGASDTFRPEEPVSAYAPRAREALLLGAALFGGGHISFYENLYLYKAFIDDGRPELLLSFSRDTLTRLREWDERHGSELLRTLETFFELDRSVRRTAERLGIHRHTLRNRLEKIEEATACPVRGEGGMSFELILAYKHLSKVKL